MNERLVTRRMYSFSNTGNLGESGLKFCQTYALVSCNCNDHAIEDSESDKVLATIALRFAFEDNFQCSVSSSLENRLRIVCKT